MFFLFFFFWGKTWQTQRVCSIPHTRYFWLPVTHLPLVLLARQRSYSSSCTSAKGHKHASVCLCRVFQFGGLNRGEITEQFCLVPSQAHLSSCGHDWQCFKQMVVLRWGGRPSICQEKPSAGNYYNIMPPLLTESSVFWTQSSLKNLLVCYLLHRYTISFYISGRLAG